MTDNGPAPVLPGDDSIGQRIDEKIAELRTEVSAKVDEIQAKVQAISDKVDAIQGGGEQPTQLPA